MDGDRRTRGPVDADEHTTEGAKGSRPAWLDQVEGRPRAEAPASRADKRRAASPAPRAGNGAAPAGPASEERAERAIASLREEARSQGRSDGEFGVPAADWTGPPDAEAELVERCRGLFERWFAARKREALEEVSEVEERASEKLGRISLALDRFQRMTNELIRLKARFSVRKEQVTDELRLEEVERPRGIPTKVYALALAFLGLVEFFANAPVFSALLPRDPLTERQIRVLTEMSEGWFAGAERVLAQLVFRPDAALLAAGVITFLCVLCHFFGSSLRELVMQRDAQDRRYTVQGRSALENAVPLVLTSVGLILVLGVLYQARIDLGQVGEERFAQDMEQVEELRRDAGWLRVDGELLQANELTNRADDLHEAATELREYSYAMARMSFPILLLNLTLVLCAISAAYFHRRDARREHFNESPFEHERRRFVETGEEVAAEASRLLSEVVRDIRALKALSVVGPADEWRSVAHELESVVKTYRAENARVRGIEAREVAAFRRAPDLGLAPPETAIDLLTRRPEDYEEERRELARRFDEIRARFNDEATANW